MYLVGWRKVPIDTSVLGELALARLPRIEQVFVAGPGLDDQQLAGRGQAQLATVLHLSSEERHWVTRSHSGDDGVIRQ